MKKLLFIFSILLSLQSSAQETQPVSYADSSLTVVITQGFAVQLGNYIRNRFEWQERDAPTKLKNYIGSGTDLDSLAGTVVVKAKHVLAVMDALNENKLGLTYEEYRQIVLGVPTVAGYTGMAAQINSKANGTGPEKNAAIWARDEYAKRTAANDALKKAEIQETVIWSRN